MQAEDDSSQEGAAPREVRYPRRSRSEAGGLLLFADGAASPWACERFRRHLHGALINTCCQLISPAPSCLPKHRPGFPGLHLQIHDMSKTACDAAPQRFKPQENWTDSFMLWHEDTRCFDFQRLLFFHFISNLVTWNFHVFWSRISFEGIRYSSLSSTVLNGC